VLGCCLLGAGAPAMPLPAGAGAAPLTADGPDLIRLAQAQAPQPSPTPPPDAQAPAGAAPADQPSAAQNSAEEPIGNVATLTGVATVVRNKDSIALKLKDDIYLNDAVLTAASSSLGITFNDGTTFHLTANAKITIDNYVYEDGGNKNAGAFDIAKGTVAFVAAAVAKTGNMQITTPTSTLGIRGTTGLVEVPEGASATSTTNNVNIKLYPDADGHVGRIEINDRQGARLGALTQGASGFAIRPGTGGARFAAVPITISPQQQQRDQGFVRQVHATQTVGRQIVTEQRAIRRANPPQSRQPGQPGQPGVPRQPGQNRPGQPGTPQQPGQNRPGQPQQKGTPGNRQGQQQHQPGNPRAGQNTQPANPAQPGTPSRSGKNAQPANSAQPTTPSRAGQNARPATPAAPGAPAQPNAQPRTTQPAPPPLPPGQPLLHQGGRTQVVPGAQRPRQPAPKDKRQKKR